MIQTSANVRKWDITAGVAAASARIKMYKQTRDVGPQKMICPECQSTMFRVNYNSLTCTDCGHVIKKQVGNKFGAIRTDFNGKKYDSKFEASVAEELEIRKIGKDIKDYDTQYKVEMWAYREDGLPGFKVSHKVDFRIHHNDGSFELLEAKGVETADYKMRRKFLENLWLPLHKDHTYTVVKQYNQRRKR